MIFISLIFSCMNKVFVEDVYQKFEKIFKISLDQEYFQEITFKKGSYLKVWVFFMS